MVWPLELSIALLAARELPPHCRVVYIGNWKR